VLSTLLVVLLLGGTAAAFAVTQGLKIEPSPILAPRIDKVFSPVCDCGTRVAGIRFRLRKPDRVQLDIVDSSGNVVRELVSGKRLRRGTVTYTWNGRDDQGRFVGEGVYKPRVHLADQHRTIDLPNDMLVDTTAPKIALVSVTPRAFSPDGDGRGDRVVVAYKTSEPAHGVLLVDGRRVVFTRKQQQRSTLDWNGRVDGRVLTPGVHRLQLAAQDRAGNLSEAGNPFDVELRYVTVARDRIEARAGSRFGVGVSADAPVQWRLGARRGTAKPGLLVVRAPRRPGRYTLVVRVGDHSARAAVIVRPG
jgi:flagellar hook capping protein FlgD